MLSESKLRQAIIEAHNLTGAPGTVETINTEHEFMGKVKGNYTVHCQYNYRNLPTNLRVYQWEMWPIHKGVFKVRVTCNWSIAGDKQRKQKTIIIEE